MIMKSCLFLGLMICIAVLTGCPESGSVNREPRKDVPVAENFSFPIGPDRVITQKRDRQDDWYNAQDFGENNHLGEDWNKNSGGNTDCGEPVFAAANGWIVYAGDAGYAWGNVIIITHQTADGTEYQTLYGHLRKLDRTEGIVKKREKIGTVGNADGYYKCHLHFELRTRESPQWNKVFRGYSSDRDGWIDPSDFISRNRN